MPHDDDNPTLARAKKLRRDMTDVERRLWSRLRSRHLNGAKFRRQVPIGPYIVDFACHAAKLVVELDGGQHAIKSEADKQRSAFLRSCGYRVIRFWNNDVTEDLEGVLTRISQTLDGG